MKEFNGRSFLTVDSKGRLFLPQGYRDLLGENFVISLSEDLKTPAFYTKEDWDKKSALLRRIPQTDRRAHGLLRMIFSATFPEYNTDAQGRVLIPLALRQLYGLNEGSEAVLAGVGSTLEIWNAAAFEASMNALEGESAGEALDYIYDTYFSTGIDAGKGDGEA
ncbi:MAG: hypothetical protein K5663_00180 [Clostridiales bacterium]|nr:hypothetical protein [Clostridiales bacterium]